MKIEKLSKGINKKIILSIVIITLLIGVVYITNSKAKYQVTQSVQIVNGKVNYKLPDLNVLALQVQDSKGSETYNQAETVPIGNYEVNTNKSYCTLPGSDTHLTNIPIEYKNNRVSISINKKGTKCYVFLDVATTKKVETAIGTIDVNLYVPDFSKTSCDKSIDLTCGEETNGIFKGTETINGEERNTYYYRGTVNNNYISFAGFYWRIIRINGNGSIRIIYNGTSAEATGKATVIDNENAHTFIKDGKNNDNAYVGYMYGETNQPQSLDGYNKTHTNTYDSGIKEYIDNWYATVLSKANNNGKSATNYIDTEAGFCGDRTPYQYDGISATSQPDKNKYGAGKTNTYYGAWYRRTKLYQPTFDCPNTSNDLYTVKNAKTGNHKLTNPIGLITADEAVFAGGQGKNNSGYWLYTNTYYWTMSPSANDNNFTSMLHISSIGFVGGVDISHLAFIRPVINLKGNTIFKTSSEQNKGTATNPYIVQ